MFSLSSAQKLQKTSWVDSGVPEVMEEDWYQDWGAVPWGQEFALFFLLLLLREAGGKG